MSFFEKLKNTFSKKNDQAVYLSGFKKTKDSLSAKLNSMSFTYNGINDEFLEELTIVLLESDVGIETTDEICLRLKNLAKKYPKISFHYAMEFLIEICEEIYNEKPVADIVMNDNGPTVILMVGVNGSGKTTSTAKLASMYLDMGKTVALVAADTFRAGATEQLQAWADSLSIPCIIGKANCDPSSVLVDGCRYAKENNIDILLCDTAGRLQNKVNLMNELAKMRKVVAREIEGAPHNVWLVLDGTTGQNGLSQARLFQEVTHVTGIILTKMDGTAKGGIVMAIKYCLNIPVYYIGLGEKVTDLRPFDSSAYLYSISEGLASAR